MTALPQLREDLGLQEGGRSRMSMENWLVYDPLRHQYIQFDEATFSILVLWRGCTTREALNERVSQQLGAPLPDREIDRLIEFLDQQHLLASPERGWQHLAKTAASRRHGLIASVVHRYLFFKIPLCDPTAFFKASLPWVAPLFSRTAAVVVLSLGLVGLYLVSRQWDRFVGDIAGLISIEGAIALGLTLFVVKMLHELGHGYVATMHGCRVPTLGIAIMLMAPMLYTDVTDAWRLKDRRKRLQIDAAGVGVELGLACIATLLWSFLGDGSLRTVMLIVATTSWAMSVAINLNPFMRFDGYYILADAVKIENLQARSFQIGQWKLREILFGLGVRCPEQLPHQTIRWLAVYAWTTWLVRLASYFGIALAVYAYFFKALGIVLFGVELWYFILRPLVSELKDWWGMRDRIRMSRRSRVTIGFAAVLLALAVLPWSTTVYVPAVLESSALARLYPPRAARIVKLHVASGQRVAAGDLVVSLDVPDLAFEISGTRARLKAVVMRLDRLSADGLDRDDKLVLDGERASLRTRLAELEKQRTELEVRAPIGGVVRDLDSGLREGRWLAAKDQLALIKGSSDAEGRGYIAEADIGRVEPGARGRFVPDDPLAASISVRLHQVAISGANVLDIAELATTSGGRIPIQNDPKGRLVPVSAQYHVVLKVPEAGRAPDATMRGLVHLAGKPESAISRVWRRALRVMILESGA